MKTDTSINWENKPALLVNPLKKKKLERHFILFMMAISLCIGFYLWIGKELPKIESQLSNDLIKPEMSIKANEGKVLALLWMAKHYPDMQTLGKLESLIEQGSTEAMLIKAQYYYYLDKPLAISLINQAAQEGHPDAIRYLSDKKVATFRLQNFLNMCLKVS